AVLHYVSEDAARRASFPHSGQASSSGPYPFRSWPHSRRDMTRKSIRILPFSLRCVRMLWTCTTLRMWPLPHSGHAFLPSRVSGYPSTLWPHSSTQQATDTIACPQRTHSVRTPPMRRRGLRLRFIPLLLLLQARP